MGSLDRTLLGWCAPPSLGAVLSNARFGVVLFSFAFSKPLDHRLDFTGLSRINVGEALQKEQKYSEEAIYEMINDSILPSSPFTCKAHREKS